MAHYTNLLLTGVHEDKVEAESEWFNEREIWLQCVEGTYPPVYCACLRNKGYLIPEIAEKVQTLRDGWNDVQLLARDEHWDQYRFVVGEYVEPKPKQYLHMGQTILSPTAQAVKDLKGLQKQVDFGSIDEETSHSRADKVLCDLLRKLGHDVVADAFEEVDKWYA
jgi:hypothetical protein